MQPTVIFRDFEERDIDFVYKCKNDEKLNSLIVAQYHPFTYEEAVDWVHGCMGEHETFKFWAIATNDDEQRIVGWVSLSNIDFNNRSACLHGMVIGDRDYRDGFAWIEAHIFIFEYVFEYLRLNRIYGESIVGHKASNAMEKVMFFTREGVKRQALYRDGVYYDLSYVGLLHTEYMEHKKNGEYSIKSIIKRIRNTRK